MVGSGFLLACQKVLSYLSVEIPWRRHWGATMDVIRLKEITIFPRLGTGELEKEWVQKVTLDVELYLDLAAAGSSDDLQETIDYQRIYELVREVSDARKYHLIEALAQRIGGEIQTRFSVERVVVRVRKLSLPFDAHLSCIEVEMSIPPVPSDRLGIEGSPERESS